MEKSGVKATQRRPRLIGTAICSTAPFSPRATTWRPAKEGGGDVVGVAFKFRAEVEDFLFAEDSAHEFVGADDARGASGGACAKAAAERDGAFDADAEAAWDSQGGVFVGGPCGGGDHASQWDRAVGGRVGRRPG